MSPLCKYCGPLGGPLPDACMNCNSLVEASECPWMTKTDWDHLEKEINRLRKALQLVADLPESGKETRPLKRTPQQIARRTLAVPSHQGKTP